MYKKLFRKKILVAYTHLTNKTSVTNQNWLLHATILLTILFRKKIV